MTFLSKRFIRLESSLLPVLFICGVAYIVRNVDFSAKAYIGNIFMLGWFVKLPGLGHLWFVTMIFACYVMFSILRRSPEKFQRIWFWLLFVPLQVLLEKVNFPGYFFLVLMYCGITFIYAQDIMQLLNRVRILPVAVIALIVNTSVVCLLKCEVISIGHLPYYYATSLSEVSMFALLFKLFKTRKPNGLLWHISTISYEVYLVHHPFCQGPFNLFVLLPAIPSWIVILLVVTVSLTLVFALHKLSERLNNICLNMLFRTCAR